MVMTIFHLFLGFGLAVAALAPIEYARRRRQKREKAFKRLMTVIGPSSA